jgi:hypothetical protein
MAVMESGRGSTNSAFDALVRIDKTQGEESASFSIADMIADIDF